MYFPPFWNKVYIAVIFANFFAIRWKLSQLKSKTCIAYKGISEVNGMCMRKAHCLFMYNGETESTLTRTLKIENEILGRGGGVPLHVCTFWNKQWSKSCVFKLESSQLPRTVKLSSRERKSFRNLAISLISKWKVPLDANTTWGKNYLFLI